VSGSIMDTISGRRSIRNFSNRDVSDAQINLLLEAAVSAPSAGNLQPWFFFVTRNPKIKEKLAAASFGQSFIAQAPAVIVVCAEPSKSAARYGERGAGLYCLQDTAAAVQNILLAAWGLGLGTCWVGAFDEAGVSSVLGLEKTRRPVAVIPMGYPKEKPMSPSRRPLEEVVRDYDE